MASPAPSKHVLTSYRKMCRDHILTFHPRQYALLEKMALMCERHSSWSWWKSPFRAKNKGIYLYGSVGCGKTIIMDLLYRSLAEQSLRIHFHSLMLWIHRELAQKIDGQYLSLPQFLDKMLEGKRFLFLDEFLLDNIVSISLIEQMFRHLWRRGILVMTTSNLPVEALYQEGLLRERFQCFLEALKNNMHLLPTHIHHDYRQGHEAYPGITHAPPDGDRASLRALFEQQHPHHSRKHRITLAGRTRFVRTNGHHLWFSFEALCGTSNAPSHDVSGKILEDVSQSPYGPKDYHALIDAFDAFFLADIPPLQEHHEATERFIIFIDRLYQEKKALLFSAHVSLKELFPDGRTASMRRLESRITEMGSSRYWKRLKNPPRMTPRQNKT